MLSPRKLEATSAQNVEFLQVIAKREEAIHQSQLRLEEKTRECGSLARQLESAIDDARRQVSLSSITNSLSEPIFPSERWASSSTCIRIHHEDPMSSYGEGLGT